MEPFTQTVTPHQDILEGRLTMDVFAADLWQVARGNAPSDYQDPDLFFAKTFLTRGLNDIINIAKARLEGKSGDSVVQLQTPFGGGKTHTLIALYHKAREWNVHVVVFDGTALNPREAKPWEELERQLTGKIALTNGDIAPGKQTLITLLTAHSPVLILMDEILEYVTKAAGIKVGDSNLAAQTFAFLQELMSSVSTVGNAMLVLTLPSSILEHYDENATRMFHQLQKISGRMEKIYTPVEDDEIEQVVRARLFSSANEAQIKLVVDKFVEYARKENLLTGDEIAEYREQFQKSYPFKPDVIDVLYKRWGSFPSFQRTRGVLRLLSLVVHDLLDKNLPFIRLGDFNLTNKDIQRELIKHIGEEWSSIIAQDITSRNAGARKADDSLSCSYKHYHLGVSVATTIFMLSFSGRGEGVKGSSMREIKLSAVHPEFSSNMIDTVLSNLKEKLFYLSDEGYFFSNEPNLNRIITVREENIPQDAIYEEEKRVLQAHLSKYPRIKVYLFPKFPKDIPDNAELKVAILDSADPERDFLEKYGENPRIYRNTLLFLCRDESQKEQFYRYLRKRLALKSIESDSQLQLTKRQKKEVKDKLKEHKGREYDELRKLYRKLYLPAREGFKTLDMGIPTFGETWKLDQEIHDYLRNQGEILEKIDPRVIKDKYLVQNDHVEIKKLHDSLLKTPGEIRLLSEKGFIESIKEGTKRGLFGFGHVSSDGDEIECLYLNETPTVTLSEGEVIIRPDLCMRLMKEKETVETLSEPSSELVPSVGELEIEAEIEAEVETAKKTHYSKVTLELEVPARQIATIARIANFLSTKFDHCVVEVTIHARDGEISIVDYEDKVQEALQQATQEGVVITTERKE